MGIIIGLPGNPGGRGEVAGAVQGSSSASTRRRCREGRATSGVVGGKREKAWARRVEAGVAGMKGTGELVSGYG